MSDFLKEQITNELKKAKEDGKVRVKNIREIFTTAFNQAMAELKEGSSEIRSHVKDAGSAVVGNFDKKAQTVTEENSDQEQKPVPVVVEIIEDNTNTEEIMIPVVVDENTQEEVITPVIVDSLPIQVDETEAIIKTDVETTRTDIPTRLEAIFKTIADAIKEGKIATLRQELTEKFQTEWQEIDTKLLGRYGDRYTKVKHYLQNAKTWYLKAKAKMDAGETSVLQKKQTEIDVKCAQAGVSAAQKEQEFKQQIKEAWQAIGSK